MNPAVRVTIAMEGYPTNDDFHFVIPIDKYLLMEATQKIETPSLDSDIGERTISEYVCPTKLRISTALQRERITEALSNGITERVIEFFERRDTVNGYTKQEDNEFYMCGGKK